MNPRDYFPLGKAHGKAFCNREFETDWLLKNIRAVKHSLIMAPRRFGKSSLAEKSITMTDLPLISLNFNTCTDEYEIEALIRRGVTALIGKALGPIEKMIQLIKNSVTNLTPKINLGPEYAKLELIINQQNNPAENVSESIQLLEKLLAEKNQKAILLFDEFQTVGLIAKGKGVEAAIRNAVQDTKHLTIIFSGSNRNLLKSMFEDESRPLYKLCRKLHLNRIGAEHYQKHLNKAAHFAWNADLPKETFERIMQLSEQHPYYVNYLCDILWSENETSSLPKLNKVDKAWARVIEEEHSDANVEIAQLSMGQKKVLKHIAEESSGHLLSIESASKLGMAGSSISGAISVLLEKDILEKQEDGSYLIINPIIKWVLNDSLSTNL